MSEAERLSLTIDDYHNSRQWFSNSDLSYLAKWDRGNPIWTPHLMKEHLNRTEPRKPTKAMEFGTAFDVLTTDSGQFDKLYAVTDTTDKRTKAYKSFVADNPFKKILTCDEYEQMDRMADSLFGHPEFPTGERLYSQSTIRWKWSPDVGLQCRPDLEYEALVVDVKTTVCTNPEDWMKDVVKFGYHRQAALYVEGAELAAGMPLSFQFAVVSKEPPYPSWIAELTKSAIELGRQENEMLLSILESCLKLDVWECPWQTEISRLELPYWAYPRER